MNWHAGKSRAKSSMSSRVNLVGRPRPRPERLGLMQAGVPLVPLWLVVVTGLLVLLGLDGRQRPGRCEQPLLKEPVVHLARGRLDGGRIGPVEGQDGLERAGSGGVRDTDCRCRT